MCERRKDEIGFHNLGGVSASTRQSNGCSIHLRHAVVSPPIMSGTTCVVLYLNGVSSAAMGSVAAVNRTYKTAVIRSGCLFALSSLNVDLHDV